MKILLLGKTGQLGWELNRTLLPLGDITCLEYPEIDFSDGKKLSEIVLASKANMIVNAVAYTAVDRAESEVDLCRKVNAIAPGILAEAAKKLKASFIHYSTDYVFDGAKGSPYVETELPNPLSIYGKTKLEGEQAIQQVGGSYLIFRTSWVYSTRQGGFILKVMQWAREQELLRIVSDQISNPTWARALAEATALVLARPGEDYYDWLADRSGVYHLAGSGYASRYEWAKTILAFSGIGKDKQNGGIVEAATQDFPTPAQRPLFSALNCDHFYSTFGLQLPDWRETLCLAMSQ